MEYDKRFITDVEEAEEAYNDEVMKILNHIPNVEFKSETISGIDVKPIYTPADVKDIDFWHDIGFPGQYPYTRGAFSAGHKIRFPSIRQVTGEGTAEATNKRWKFLLSKGATALAVVGSASASSGSLGGYGPDTDDDRTLGYAGKTGVMVDTLADFEDLFDGIDLRQVSVNMIAGNVLALAWYVAVAEKQGIPLNELRGSMSNVIRNSPDCIDVMEFCARNMPRFNSVYIDIRNLRDGGLTAPQEIAYGLALAMAGADKMLDRGVDFDDWARGMSWYVSSGSEFFEEVAKFRALRRMWASIAKEKYTAKSSRSMMVRMHVQTEAASLTLQQPFNNIIRSTMHGLAAVLGGAQSMSVNCFDEAMGIPSEISATLAVRTQQIINMESGVTNVVDPLGGSYYIEWLTDRLEQEAQKILDEIQEQGGAFKAIDWMEKELRESALRYQQSVDSGKRTVVGVNAFVEDNDLQWEWLRGHEAAITEYDPSVRDEQIMRLNKVKAGRDPLKLEEVNEKLFNAYRDGVNMVPVMIEAVKSYITGGEIREVRDRAIGNIEEHILSFEPLAATGK